MAKRKVKNEDGTIKGDTFEERELARMSHRDLQKACIARGMDFEDVVSYSHYRLSSWFIENHHFSQSLQLLNEFDDWLETQLKPDMLPVHSALKMGYIGERDNEGNVTKAKRVKGVGLSKPQVSKRERDDKFGIFTGTKKALTYQLANQGKSAKDKEAGIPLLSINEIIEQVKEIFPQAVDKSIKIWAKKALKPNK